MVSRNEMISNDILNERIELNGSFHNQREDFHMRGENSFNQTADYFNQRDYSNQKDSFSYLTDDISFQNFVGFHPANDYINGFDFSYSRELSFDSRENLTNPGNDIILEEEHLDASPLSHNNQEKNIKDENKCEKEDNTTKNQQNNIIINIENEDSNSTTRETPLNSKETTSQNKPKEKKKILGRKSNKEKALNQEDSLHGIYSEDNILVKVQNHYINFIISLSNCILPHFNYNKNLYNLDKKFKINIKKNESLNDKTIGEIISNKISEKYTSINDKTNANKNIYEEIKKSPIINKILSENYLVFFKKFYFSSDSKINLKDYGLDKDITFTKKVKNFKQLLIANEERGAKYIRIVKEIIHRNYLPGLKFICH